MTIHNILNIQHNQDGTNNRTMESARAHNNSNSAKTAQRSARRKTARSAQSFKWYFCILRIGAPWKHLPARYPPHQNCHRRFQQWVQLGVFNRIAQELAQGLYQPGRIDIREAFLYGCFVPVKKGLAVGKTKRGIISN